VVVYRILKKLPNKDIEIITRLAIVPNIEYIGIDLLLLWLCMMAAILTNKNIVNMIRLVKVADNSTLLTKVNKILRIEVIIIA
jgi:hypothetical protein